MIRITTDAKEVYEKFEQLNFTEMGKALKSGLRKALKVIQKDAKTNLKSAVNNTNKKNPKYNDTLQQDVRTSRIFVNQDGTVVGKVRVDSNNKSGSGSFRLPILESGSYKGERFTKTYNGKALKKEASKGSLKPKKFFKQAMDSNEASFQSNMISEVNKAIDKINNG